MEEETVDEAGGDNMKPPAIALVVGMLLEVIAHRMR
jgi:hypothetical protein